MLAQRGVHVGEDHALSLEVLVDLVIHDLGFVLGTDSGEELPLGLGNAEAVEGSLDVLGHVVPRPAGRLGSAHEVPDIVIVELGQHRGAPRRLFASKEVVERF